MTVKKGDFVRMDYTESVDRKVIATTDKDVATASGIFEEDAQYGPHLVIIGAGQVVPGLDDELVGKEAGVTGRIEVPPEKAFGEHDPKKVETVPATRFKTEQKPTPGMRVSAEGKTGVVTRIIGRKVVVDFNHLLAGKTIVYDYKIVDEVQDRLEKLKAMIKTFSRADLEAKLEGDVATIYVPWELNYYKEWFMIRRGLADMIIQHLGLNEVDYVEKHTGAKVSAELISPPAKEQAGEAAGAAQTASEPKPEAESTGSSPA